MILTLPNTMYSLCHVRHGIKCIICIAMQILATETPVYPFFLFCFFFVFLFFVLIHFFPFTCSSAIIIPSTTFMPASSPFLALASSSPATA